jgi:hypothetical protein
MESQLPFKRRFSFEFFPPKTENGMEKLREVRDTLARRKPDFFSVTYGAGGTTRERTLDTVFQLHDLGISTAPHLSCIGADRASITELLDQYKERGIQRIVALRGDLPSGVGVGAHGELRYANDLVALIRQHSGDHFQIEVAAYPETHPAGQQCAGRSAELQKEGGMQVQPVPLPSTSSTRKVISTLSTAAKNWASICRSFLALCRLPTTVSWHVSVKCVARKSLAGFASSWSPTVTILTALASLAPTSSHACASNF